MPDETTKFASKLDELKSQPVAGTLEGTPDIEAFTYGGMTSRQWGYKIRHSGGRNFGVLLRNFSQAYAAAVSKASREELAELKRGDNPYLAAAYSMAHRDIEKLQARISELERQRRWIPVEEKLPPDGQTVLTYQTRANGDEFIATTSHFDAEWYTEDQSFQKQPKVTHWMPLPSAPELAAIRSKP